MAVLGEEYYIGAGIKLLINITASGFDIDTNDYDIIASCGGKTVTYTQEDIYVSGGNHYLCIDTELFKPGNLKLVIVAKVPDDAFSSGIRKEVDVKLVGPLKHT